MKEGDWFNCYQEIEDFLFDKLDVDFPLDEGTTDANTISAIEKYAERVAARKLASYIRNDEQAIREDERRKCAYIAEHKVAACSHPRAYARAIMAGDK